ncbi:hypothetical protein E2C01_101814 [Portunus trituberculatus]|uniref:Uncharacterized protein n=1 Tax=Portunus trituberculatus TaxID=210409 RepID=A0A5B7KMU2_PORTR|nr:hypothetical protein [Portunus trituberculatus]
MDPDPNLDRACKVCPQQLDEGRQEWLGGRDGGGQEGIA